jgi:hypothetical protein
MSVNATSDVSRRIMAEERCLAAEARADHAEKALLMSQDFYERRFRRLRTWVTDEVRPLSEEVYLRYWNIVANGAATPGEQFAVDDHAWTTRDDLPVCSRCGVVRNVDKVTRCRGSLPAVRTR